MGFDLDRLFVIAAVVAVVVIASLQRRPSRQCPRCREVNREAAVFCAQCGERLPGR
jgi:hypothetical protein